MTRRNIIPNPAPVGTTGWERSESNATLGDFSNTDGLHYSAVATGAPCQAGVYWGDASLITVRPEENYGVVIPVEVVDRPTVGFLRVVVLWRALDSVTGISTWFGPDLPVGTTEVRELITAPPGAYRAAVGVIYQTTGSDTPDTVTPIDFTARQFLLEPLGPTPDPAPGAVTNHVRDPSVEYGGFDWLPHTHDADAILPGTTFEPQTGWASEGTHSMRHTITSTAGIIPGTTFYGFVGSYVGGLYEVSPGDVVNWDCDVNVLDGPATGPGVFLEIFFYYYDGDPAHTEKLLQVNGDSINQPLNIGVPETLTVTGTAPPGTTHAQITVVMAAGAPSSLLDFYADAALLTINDETAFFDGDTAGAGWNGLPGKSTSVTPGRDARTPGAFFDGNTPGAQWEGEPCESMCTFTPPPLRRPGALSLETMRFLAASA